jgi:hypothetical protein
MLRSFFWLALLAGGFSIRIPLFGYMELDHPIRMLSPDPTTPLVYSVTKKLANPPKVSLGQAITYLGNGLTPSSQRVGSLSILPWPAKPARKII